MRSPIGQVYLFLAKKWQPLPPWNDSIIFQAHRDLPELCRACRMLLTVSCRSILSPSDTPFCTLLRHRTRLLLLLLLLLLPGFQRGKLHVRSRLLTVATSGGGKLGIPQDIIVMRKFSYLFAVCFAVLACPL